AISNSNRFEERPDRRRGRRQKREEKVADEASGPQSFVPIGDVLDDFDRSERAMAAKQPERSEHLIAAKAVRLLEADARRVLRLEAVEVDRDAKSGGPVGGARQRFVDDGREPAAAHLVHEDDADAEPLQKRELAGLIGARADVAEV